MYEQIDPNDEYQWSSDGIVCPYCGYVHNPSEYYESAYNEDETMYCEACDKKFKFSCHISYSWESSGV